MGALDYRLVGIPFWDVSANVLVEPRVGATNSRRLMPHFGIVASLGANVDVRYHFYIQTAPSATLKAVLTAIANATTGNAKVNISWAAGSDPNFDTLSLTAEGTTTITWASGDTDEMKTTKITLDATTLPTAGQYLILQVRFETSSWTLAQKSYWSLALIDE